jgi:hypothetical protein
VPVNRARPSLPGRRRARHGAHDVIVREAHALVLAGLDVGHMSAVGERDIQRGAGNDRAGPGHVRPVGIELKPTPPATRASSVSVARGRPRSRCGDRLGRRRRCAKAGENRAPCNVTLRRVDERCAVRFRQPGCWRVVNVRLANGSGHPSPFSKSDVECERDRAGAARRQSSQTASDPPVEAVASLPMCTARRPPPSPGPLRAVQTRRRAVRRRQPDQQPAPVAMMFVVMMASATIGRRLSLASYAVLRSSDKSRASRAGPAAARPTRPGGEAECKSSG